jgi:hypothetical protein
MILLTPDLRFTLRANAINRRAAARGGKQGPDPVPVVKFFLSAGTATWLCTELAADGDTIHGLADLGFGYPELGVFSLSEIASVRLPFGMGIERDIGFESIHPISVWAEWSRHAGSIIAAEQILSQTARPSGNELPPTGG